jgi:uncharacterized protein (TIGR02145 family)
LFFIFAPEKWLRIFYNSNDMRKIIFVLLLSGLIMNLSGQAKFTDPRDGNVYRTITVAGVTWMAENLKYKSPGTGESCFDNDPNNIPNYGALYEWKIAAEVCPSGWHLPSGDEFRALADNFDHDKAWVKSESGPLSFGIQLAGMQDYEGTFTEMGESAYYWTSTEYDKDDAEYFCYLIINNAPVIDISRKSDVEEIHGTEKSNKYSIRCVKDANTK